MSKKEDIRRINEDIAARFLRIETGIQTAPTVAGLFEALLNGIEKEFSVPFVWLTLIDREDTAPLTEALRASDALENRVGFVLQEQFDLIMPAGAQPVLANRDLRLFYKMLPVSRKYFIRSVAVVPLVLDGRVIGTWNNGDADPDRYREDMDTSFLAEMAQKISARLAELTADKSRAGHPGENQGEPGGLHG